MGETDGIGFSVGFGIGSGVPEGLGKGVGESVGFGNGVGEPEGDGIGTGDPVGLGIGAGVFVGSGIGDGVTVGFVRGAVGVVVGVAIGLSVKSLTVERCAIPNAVIHENENKSVTIPKVVLFVIKPPYNPVLVTAEKRISFNFKNKRIFIYDYLR